MTFRPAEPGTSAALHGITFQIGIVAGSALGSLALAAGLLAGVPLAAAAGGLAAFVLLAFTGRAFRPGPND